MVTTSPGLVAEAAVRRAAIEEGFAKDSPWARVLLQRWSDPSYLVMVARTIDTMEDAEFWLALLGKQVQLQSTRAQLKAQRLDRHKLEQRRKKHTMAAYYAALGEKPRGDSDLRFGDLSLYALDWIGPRTCAELDWADGNDVCALSLETDILVLYSKLMIKSVEVQELQNRLFSSGGPDVFPAGDRGESQASVRADTINANVVASLRPNETYDWDTITREIYLPALSELQAPGATAELFSVELSQVMAALDHEEHARSRFSSSSSGRDGSISGARGGPAPGGGSWTASTTAGGQGTGAA
ncbi:hypothetical protein BESB_067410 [Besnoitia besnoiti]|uniref:Uncharacterized protein n=1 Tax=Besnoitia besnoiti TaxID=94643 RepID=A0A2A9M898_BESBE|nr:hypothetical protein BESB_067410 [Besnoitia besnoiti]PFH34708.1 hypothetical protein BESB_067410 [Besnoitia besnoiti]